MEKKLTLIVWTQIAATNTFLLLVFTLLLIACNPSTPEKLQSTDTEVLNTKTIAPATEQVPLTTNTFTECVDHLVSGDVISGGYVGPENIKDAPRKYVYEILNEKETFLVSYTAYPPSPVGDERKIELKFHTGEILVGDYLIACGVYDKSTKTLVVESDGQYIQTFPENPSTPEKLQSTDTEVLNTKTIAPATEQVPLTTNTFTECVDHLVSGDVISGGYVGPENIKDAPRKYVYEILNEKETFLVSYTAYPPSPVGDERKIELKFHTGEILVGDYLIACGVYNKPTKTFVVESDGQYIWTFARKP
ncbi:hypothetical protein ACFLV7_14090 [Chloroflexota bacterium]